MVRVLRDPNKKGTGAPRGTATGVTARVAMGAGAVAKDVVSRSGIRRLIARDPAKGSSANIGTKQDRVNLSGFRAGGQASLTTSMAGANNDIVFRATKNGTGANSIRVAVVVAGANTVLSVAVSGNDITINSATNGSSVATTTADQAIAAVKASTQASALILAERAPGNDGSGVIAAFSLTNLTGGSDSVLEGTNPVAAPNPTVLSGSRAGKTDTHKNVSDRGTNRRVKKS